MSADVIERAMVEGACRVLSRRAETLRKFAVDLTTVVEHRGRKIPVAAPEASIALGTARLFDECAADVAALLLPVPKPPTAVPALQEQPREQPASA